jgi:hypothetical protein
MEKIIYVGLGNECVYELFDSLYYCYTSPLICVIKIWYKIMVEFFTVYMHDSVAWAFNEQSENCCWFTDAIYIKVLSLDL